MSCVCGIDFLGGCCRKPSQNERSWCSTASAIQCTVQRCCTEWKFGPCTIVLFENLLALVWVRLSTASKIRLMTSLARILLGTELKSNSSPVVTVGKGSFLRNLHDDTLRPVFRWLFLFLCCCKEWLKNCGSALKISALRLSCLGAFPFLRHLMVTIISSFSGGAVLTSRTVLLLKLSAVCVPGRLCWSVYRLLWSAPAWYWCRSCRAMYTVCLSTSTSVETCSSVGGWRYSLV